MPRRRTSSTASWIFSATARVRRRRGNGRRPARSQANASRRATRASTRAFCWRWRALRWPRPATICRSGGSRPWKNTVTSAARFRCSRSFSSTTRCWRGSARSRPRCSTASEPPDFVFYTGCNVLKTPHIALLALDIMDTLGVRYQVMGGPSHCCGIVHCGRATSKCPDGWERTASTSCHSRNRGK